MIIKLPINNNSTVTNQMHQQRQTVYTGRLRLSQDASTKKNLRYADVDEQDTARSKSNILSHYLQSPIIHIDSSRSNNTSSIKYELPLLKEQRRVNLSVQLKGTITTRSQFEKGGSNYWADALKKDNDKVIDSTVNNTKMNSHFRRSSLLMPIMLKPTHGRQSFDISCLRDNQDSNIYIKRINRMRQSTTLQEESNKQPIKNS